ncbi:IS66 family transposase [Schlesneria sp. DSM 10557]|uniref:IS66 family transposase n=1 Tax=Schlesneria sp. DSM 10557 TaxID=3044399 RepID=UPI0035A0A881
MDDVALLKEQVAALLHRVAKLEAQVAERDARISELEAELERVRRQGYKPQPNRKPPAGNKKQDRRKKPFRQHPGVFRDPPKLDEIPPGQVECHEVVLDACPCCGSRRIEPTGRFDDHLVTDIPEPKPEYHRYRRHEYQCRDCGKTSQGRAELELPGSHLGPRARLLNLYCRAHLGISLGKSCDLLSQWWGIPLSRAGALGHLAWGGKLFAPVVTDLLDLLRQQNLIHADETGWRINGKNVWAWCFSNPKIAVYLIRHSRSGAVIREALGDSLAGVLVTDFYAAYNAMEATKQRCLVHLLRELHDLRQKVPAICTKRIIEPLIALFQEAMALGKQRDELSPKAYTQQCDAISDRFGELATTISTNTHVNRILKRLRKYADELFTFLDHPHVPPDNTPAERDIRSVAATRADGGVNRTDWGATAFANIKSIVRTCQKQGCQFLQYGLELIRAVQARQPTPLPVSQNSS